MIKAIIFDVGGTYMAGTVVDFVRRSYAVLGIKKEIKIKEEIIFDERLNRGQINHEDCFRKFFEVPISPEQMDKIKEIWTTTWAPTDEMIELVKALREKYTLAILSNSDSLNSEKFTKKGWYSYFKYVVLSHEIQVIKPEKKIYEIILEKLNLPANECLFIDDQPKVLVPAKEMGMDTINFKSLPQLKDELKSKGLEF